MVGMLRIPTAFAILGFSSTFTFPNTTFPESSRASCSIIGDTILQGPHQGAQKSTTNRGYLFTDSAKLASVTIIGVSITTTLALLLLLFLAKSFIFFAIILLGSSSRVDITWYNGNQRQNNFVISVSNDGTAFTNVFTGKSSGTTLSSEKYNLPANTVGRYVRITVNGNTQNNYASITEIDVYGSSGGADTTPPTVVSTNPTNNATAVPVNASITATFSEPVNSSTITATTFTLKSENTTTTPATTKNVVGTVSLSSDGKTASFKPSSNLAFSTKHIATITTGVKDLAGNAMTLPKSWSFTTTAAAANTCTNLAISDVIASGNDSSVNLPKNTIDNNLNTRWSNLGIGSWIRLDLGIQKVICSVDIAWYNGNQRQNNFVISVSNDGSTFTNVFTGKSSGTTLSSEKYNLPANTVGRYVRITVNGNTQNNYASITEIDVYGSGISTPQPPIADKSYDINVSNKIFSTYTTGNSRC